MSQTYKFRREDNGELIDVDFQTMMEMDACGSITLPSGVQARRCRHLEQPPVVHAEKNDKIVELEKPVLSDTLGFIPQQFEEFEQDRVKNGFTAIEFRQEPGVPFFQVYCSSKAEYQRYMRHRGYSDMGERNGVGQVLTQHDLDSAQERILEKYPIISAETLDR